MKITMAVDILDCREMISPMEPEFFGSVMYMMLWHHSDAIESPASPEKVKAGIDKLAAGETLTPPEKYYLGSDFMDEVEFMKENPVSW